MNDQQPSQDNSPESEQVDSSVLEDIATESGSASSGGSTPPQRANEVYWLMQKRYGGIKLAQFSQRLLEKDFETFVLVKEKQLMEEYGFDQKEIKHIIRYKPTILLYEEDYARKQRGIKALYNVLVTEMGFPAGRAKALVARYPVILQKTEGELHYFFEVLEKHGVDQREAMKLLMRIPKLISQNLEVKFKEFIFLFELYLKMEQKQFMTIFRGFPYMMCLDTGKIQRFLGEFKKYRFTNEQVVNVCIKSGGLLGCKVSHLFGLFETLRLYGLSAGDVKKILDVCPEFALQNKKDLLKKKIRLIQEESGRDEVYIRNFIQRHPDIVMKSFQSLEAKINYLQRGLGRSLKEERSFPLILTYNYNEVIKPRSEVLRTRKKDFNMAKAFFSSDGAFCHKWKIDPEELDQEKQKRRKDVKAANKGRVVNEEKERLWVYVDQI